MSDISLGIVVETDEALAELTAFSNMVDSLGTKWQRIKKTVKQEARKLLYSLQSFINLARNIFNSFGMSLDPMGEALLNIIGSVIASAIAMQYAYAAGGPVGWAMMAISALALTVAIGQQVNAARGIDEAKQAAADSLAIISSLQSVLIPWRF